MTDVTNTPYESVPEPSPETLAAIDKGNEQIANGEVTNVERRERPTPDDAEADDPIQAVETPERVAKPEPVDYDAKERKPLKDYRQSDNVVVWADNDWRRGFVNGVHKRDGVNYLLYVHTDRGPVTIMSDRGIRPA